jgi:hypothetical protein
MVVVKDEIETKTAVELKALKAEAYDAFVAIENCRNQISAWEKRVGEINANIIAKTNEWEEEQKAKQNGNSKLSASEPAGSTKNKGR